MFTRFKRRLPRFPLPPQKVDGLYNKMAGKILAVQRHWADKLSQKEQRLTIRQKKIWLLSFVLLMCSVSFSLLYKAFYWHSRASTYMRHDGIVQPANAALPDSLNLDLLQEKQRERMSAQSKHDSSKPSK